MRDGVVGGTGGMVEGADGVVEGADGVVEGADGVVEGGDGVDPGRDGGAAGDRVEGGGPTDVTGASGGALLVLTATELAVLEVAHLSGLVDHHPLADEATETGAAWLEAVASLTARGLVGPHGRLEESTAAGQLAQTVLDVRLGADTLVVVERLLQADHLDPHRQPGTRRDLRLLHLLPVGAVVEDVHAEGLHGFDLLLEPGHLVGAVTDVLVPPDAAAGPEDRGLPGLVEVPPDQAHLVAGLLGHPTVLAELTLAKDDGRSEGHLVALGPGGCWAAPRRPGGLRFVAVPTDWVARTVGDWVGGAATAGTG